MIASKETPQKVAARKRRSHRPTKTEIKPKLSHKQKLFVCSMFATGFNGPVISGMVEDQFGISIRADTLIHVYRNGPKWRPLINRLKRMMERQLMKHPLARKLNKLEILNQAIQIAMAPQLKKINYDRYGGELSKVYERNVGAVAQLIRAANETIAGEAKDAELADELELLSSEQNEHIQSRIGKYMTGGNGGVN